MVFKTRNRPLEAPENVEVGCLGGERHSERGIGRFAIEAGTRENGPGNEVRYWFHVGSSIPCGRAGQRQTPDSVHFILYVCPHFQ